MDADQQLTRIASRQHGVVSRAQALSCGLSPDAINRRLSSERLIRLHAEVYSISGVPPSRRQTLMAAVMWGGQGTAASHRAAAGLWELDGAEDILEISSPRRLRSEIVIAHRVDPLPVEDIKVVDGIPCTNVERTLIDLCSVLDMDGVEDALYSALRKKLTSLARLRLRLRRENRRRGIAILRKLLDEHSIDGQPTASRFETRLNRLLLNGRLPAVRQHKVWNGGEFVARVDFCFPEAMVIVEADSYRWHSSKRAWQRDIERRNQLTALGWQIVHITWNDLTQRPQATLARVRALLQPQLFGSSTER